MKPKEKAKELIDKFEDLVAIDYKYNEMPIFDCQKQCALIAVDEIDMLIQKLTPKDDPYLYVDLLQYFQDVKQEIENYDTKPN